MDPSTIPVFEMVKDSIGTVLFPSVISLVLAIYLFQNLKQQKEESTRWADILRANTSVIERLEKTIERMEMKQ